MIELSFAIDSNSELDSDSGELDLDFELRLPESVEKLAAIDSMFEILQVEEILSVEIELAADLSSVREAAAYSDKLDLRMSAAESVSILFEPVVENSAAPIFQIPAEA